MLKKTRASVKETDAIKNASQDYQKAINCFLKGEIGKFGKYLSVENALVYRTLITKNYGQDQIIGQDIIARRIGNELIGNSSILPLIGRSTKFGREDLNRSVTDVQIELGNFIPMIPFTVFDEAGLDLKQLEILDRGPEENVIRLRNNPEYSSYEAKYDKNYKVPKFLEENVHYTGASLFKIEDKFFLFDIDREEIKHKIFNPFLVEIPVPVKTIEQAYEALMPNEVKGKKHVRQGEFFYLPVEINPDELDVRVFGNDKNKKLDRHSNESFTIQAGNNRPNYAQMGFEHDGISYIRGRVEHSGREHRVVTLKTWHKVVPNTATSSFTVTGDID